MPRRLTAILALLLVVQSACVADPNTVTTDGVVHSNPINPEGRWHDLETLVNSDQLDAGQLTQLFSLHFREGLLTESTPDWVYPNEQWKAFLDQRTTHVESLERDNPTRLNAFEKQLRDGIARWRAAGDFFSQPFRFVGTPRRDGDDYLRGPNRAEIDLVWKPSKRTGSEYAETTLTLSFVQEYEYWKLDALPDVLTQAPPLKPESKKERASDGE